MSSNNNGFNVDLRQLPSLMCPCGSQLFAKAHEIKKLPAIISPTGKETIIWVEVGSVCCACGAFATMEAISKSEDVKEKSNLIELPNKGGENN